MFLYQDHPTSIKMHSILGEAGKGIGGLWQLGVHTGSQEWEGEAGDGQRPGIRSRTQSRYG